MNAKYFVFTLALTSLSAYAMGSRGPSSKAPAWACDQIIPKNESVCSAHQSDVRSYFNRCVASANASGAPDAISPVVAHQAASLVFARELDLLYRLRPVENYADDWARFESHWQRYLSSHPALLTVETTDALTPDARSPFLVFINNPSLYRAHAADLDRELKLRLDISPLRPASFYALGAAVLLRLLEDLPPSAARTEEQAWYETAYPELGRPNLTALADLYLSKSNQSAQSVAQAVGALSRARGEPNSAALRFSHVLEYLDKTLDAGDKHNSYFIQWLENEFTITASNILHELERSLNNDDYIADPLVLASVKSTLNPTRTLLAQNFWATECEAWSTKKRWAAVAHLNNKYLGPAAQISFAALIALSGGGLVGDAGATSAARSKRAPDVQNDRACLGSCARSADGWGFRVRNSKLGGFACDQRARAPSGSARILSLDHAARDIFARAPGTAIK